jgi:hypothetical protein
MVQTVATSGKLFAATDNLRDSIKLHVSSRHFSCPTIREDGTTDPSCFRFNIPRGSKNMKAIVLTDVEFPNTGYNVTRANNVLYFNEHNLAIKYYDDATANTPSATFDTCEINHQETRSFQAEMSPGTYTADDFCKALASAMNYATSTDPADSTKPQNTYAVTFSDLSGKIILTAVQNDGTNVTADATGLAQKPFSVRPGNTPSVPPLVVQSAHQNIWNCQTVDTDLTAGLLKNNTQDSPFRVMMKVTSGHNFIPGDTVNFSAARSTLAHNNTTLPKYSNVKCYVVYVNGQHMHLFLKPEGTMPIGKILHEGCTVRSDHPSVTRSIDIGMHSFTNRSGLLVSTEIYNTANTPNTLTYKTRVHANASSTYDNFKTNGSPNMSIIDGTHTVIGACDDNTLTHVRLAETHSFFTDAKLCFTHDLNTPVAVTVTQASGIVPKLQFTKNASLITSELRRLFETLDNTYDIGSSTIYAHNSLDLTPHNKVIFISLEAVGFGALGNIVTSSGIRKYFARVQLEAEPNSIEMNQKNTTVGVHHFTDSANFNDIILRTYNEDETPYVTQGVHMSLLLDLIQTC